MSGFLPQMSGQCRVFYRGREGPTRKTGCSALQERLTGVWRFGRQMDAKRHFSLLLNSVSL